MRDKPVYEVFAISYGVIPDFSVAGLVAGADRSRKMDIQMMVWLLKGPEGRNILVDSGFFQEKYQKQFKVKDFIKPSEAVARAGITAGQVTDVIITHMHWDHAGGITLFPKARIWIQKDEYNYYTGEAWQSPSTHGGIDADDVTALVRRNIEGNVGFVNGDDSEPIPGVRLYTGGRHTFASQYAGVNTKAGTVVIASDNCYLYENLDKHAPIAQTLDAASNLRAQDRMKSLASALRLVVPGHDPEVFVRFSKPGNGVARIE
jgi:glyoxylase-like metal-dependent hydrolase (beta-lactamase superfamily II)